MKRIFFLSVLAIVFIPLIWMSYLFHVGNDGAVRFIVSVASLTMCFALVTIAAYLAQLCSLVVVGIKKLDEPGFINQIFRKINEDDED